MKYNKEFEIVYNLVVKFHNIIIIYLNCVYDNLPVLVRYKQLKEE